MVANDRIVKINNITITSSNDLHKAMEGFTQRSDREPHVDRPGRDVAHRAPDPRPRPLARLRHRSVLRRMRRAGGRHRRTDPRLHDLGAGVLGRVRRAPRPGPRLERRPRDGPAPDRRIREPARHQPGPPQPPVGGGASDEPLRHLRARPRSRDAPPPCSGSWTHRPGGYPDLISDDRHGAVTVVDVLEAGGRRGPRARRRALGAVSLGRLGCASRRDPEAAGGTRSP